MVSHLYSLLGFRWEIVSHCLGIEMRSERSYGFATQEERVVERQPDCSKVWVNYRPALDI
jgi:hypothetical protein